MRQVIIHSRTSGAGSVTKVSVVDSNNVVVDYELSGCWNEKASWSVDRAIAVNAGGLYGSMHTKPANITMKGYTFDTSFHHSQSKRGGKHALVAFKLVSDEEDKEDLYLVLANTMSQEEYKKEYQMSHYGGVLYEGKV